MQNFLFIFVIILITTGLIYFVYKFILGTPSEHEDELQISESDLLEQLHILYKERKFYIIESLAKKYLEKKFANDEVRMILARSLFESKKYHNAIEEARIISRHKPKDFEIKNFIVQCYINLKQPLSAVAILKEVLEFDNTNAVAIKELAQIYIDTNQKISALRLYEQLSELVYSNQEKLKLKTIIAGIHIELGEFDEAIREYLEILDIYPANIPIKKNLFTLYRLNADFERQIEIANEILDSHPEEEDTIWCLESLCQAYMENNNYEKALEYAEQLEQFDATDKVKVKQTISEIYIGLDRIDDGIEILKDLIEENPKDIDLKKSLAKAYQSKNDFESTINVYKKLLDEENPDKIKALHTEISNIYSDWGMYLFNKEDKENENHEECFNKFDTALEYNAENPEIFYRLGEINKKIKNYTEALSQLKAAIELDEENGEYYFSLAECYEDLDNHYEEKNALLKSAKYNKEEDNAKIYYKLALIIDTQGDINKAMEYLEKSIKLNDNFIDAKYKYALLQEHKGDRDGAIETYKNILELDPTYKEAEDNLRMLSSQ